jgi:hypothetical protein
VPLTPLHKRWAAFALLLVFGAALGHGFTPHPAEGFALERTALAAHGHPHDDCADDLHANECVLCHALHGLAHATPDAAPLPLDTDALRPDAGFTAHAAAHPLVDPIRGPPRA